MFTKSAKQTTFDTAKNRFSGSKQETSTDLSVQQSHNSTLPDKSDVVVAKGSSGADEEKARVAEGASAGKHVVGNLCLL